MTPETDLNRFLSPVLLFAFVGTAVELVFLGHYEDRLQWIPLAAVSAGALSLVGVALLKSRGAILVTRFVMTGLLIAGAVGVFLHFRSNMEFELEMHPTVEGVELIWESLTGAMPALAPGTLIFMGLVGLVYTIGHPLLAGPPAAGEPPAGDAR